MGVAQRLTNRCWDDREYGNYVKENIVAKFILLFDLLSLLPEENNSTCTRWV